RRAGAFFTQESVEAGGGLRTGVEFVGEVGRMAERKGASNRPADEAVGAAKTSDRFGGTGMPLEMGEENPAVAQIIAHFDRSKRDSTQPRILQIADQHLRQLAQNHFSDPSGPPAVASSHAGDSIVRRRSPKSSTA